MGKIFKVIAYHKAGTKSIRRAVERQMFEIGKNEGRPEGMQLWLGDGIYFWEKFYDAKRWTGKGYEIDNAIVKAQLKCDEDYFLNLDDPQELLEFEKMFLNFSERVLEKGKYDFNFKHDPIVDSFSCNVFKHSTQTKLIKYSFPAVSGRPQFCATDNSVIGCITLARSGNEYQE